VHPDPITRDVLLGAVNEAGEPWNPLGLRNVLRRYRAVRAGRDVLVALHLWVKRRRQGWDMGRYISRHTVKCLQIGAGPSRASDWLCTDLEPRQQGAVYLDATRRFPIADESFDFVHSEHMIEHVPFLGGKAMLAQCHRILKPGGRIRIATPDLGRLIGLYGHDNVGVARRLIERVALGVFRNSECARPIFALNSAFRDWGHQFLYDEQTLRESLLAAGFVNVERFRYGESRSARLRGIEQHGTVSGDPEVTAFETLVLEAERA
jgi:predicted SAM-dependent methyltransferase